jgi:hypothetical protein
MIVRHFGFAVVESIETAVIIFCTLMKEKRDIELQAYNFWCKEGEEHNEIICDGKGHVFIRSCEAHTTCVSCQHALVQGIDGPWERPRRFSAPHSCASRHLSFVNYFREMHSDHIEPTSLVFETHIFWVERNVQEGNMNARMRPVVLISRFERVPS